jgi:ABC-type phosphonate transport system ATPase subunit
LELFYTGFYLSEFWRQGSQKPCVVTYPVSKLLLTDEPTAALDRQSRAELMDLVSGLARELGLVPLIVTHDHAFWALPTGSSTGRTDSSGVQRREALSQGGKSNCLIKNRC